MNTNRYFGDAIQYQQDGTPIARFHAPYISLKVNEIQGPHPSTIADSCHPEYHQCSEDWDRWRYTMDSGQNYVERFLERFSNREEIIDFNVRKRLTPIPSFAKAAVNEVKNSIFQRITDVTRVGGPDSYQTSIQGKLGGVDLQGSGINFFIGDKIINEMLSMKKVGVLVENFKDVGATLRDKGNRHPYFCVYQAEDIRNWAPAPAWTGRKYNSLLLRHREYALDEYNLPSSEEITYRHYYINQNGKVSLDIYDVDGELIQEVVLSIPEIPFVCFRISDSLLKDVTNHQIALLNIESSDINQILRAGFPFYTEQQDTRTGSSYLKQAITQSPGVMQNPDGTPITSPTCQIEDTDDFQNIRIGATIGRAYGKGLERPGFIAPPMEPLKASMEKQQKLKEDVRLLIHLAISNLTPTVQSAESKGMDQTGLEAGLSYIGLELEHGERQLAKYWAMYENAPDPATVNYPQRWSIKSDTERRDSVNHLLEVRSEVASLDYKKEVSKQVVDESIGHRISDEKRNTIFQQIDQANYIYSGTEMDNDLINGVVSKKTVSNAKGYDAEAEVKQAQVEQSERLALIKAAQSANDPAARGNPDASVNPTAGSQEKIGQPTRGTGQGNLAQ